MIQPFEKANVLSKKTTDFYFSTLGETSFVSQVGVLPIDLRECAYLGYAGIERIQQSLRRALLLQQRYLPEDQGISYRESWLKKSSNWYVKKEVS